MISKEEIRDYILKEFMPGENAGQIEMDLDLIGTGIIDSLGVLKLVAFLERKNGITIEAEELGIDNFKSVDTIHTLIAGKGVA